MQLITFFEWFYQNQTGNFTNFTSTFEKFCLEDQRLETSKANSSLLENFYNKTAIDMELAMRDWNISQLSPNITIQQVGTVLNETLFWEIDKVDDRFSNIKKDINSTYLPRDDFENYKLNVSWTMYKLEDRFYTEPNPIWWQLFAVGAAFLCIILATIKVKPDLLKHKIDFKKLPKAESKLHGTEEYALPGELKDRQNLTRNLRWEIANNPDLEREEKISLMKGVDEGKIRNTNELNKELEIIKGMKETKKARGRRKNIKDLMRL